jgi:hypothetical protein
MDPSGFDLKVASGEVPPPNRGPVADAGGPYAGTLGQSISFNAGSSSDPDGDALSYAWDFGDGVRGVGSAPEHEYSLAGAYRVCLTVADDGCPARTDSTCLTATVLEALAARVFAGGAHCFQLEPVEEDFPLSDLDPSTLVAAFGGARVPPTLDKTVLVTDSDGNGIPEMRVCFAPSALRALFDAAPPGKSQVTMALEGALRSGARVHGEVVFEIKRHRDYRAHPSGVYFYRIRTPDGSVTGRFSILK